MALETKSTEKGTTFLAMEIKSMGRQTSSSDCSIKYDERTYCNTKYKYQYQRRSKDNIIIC